MFSTRKLFYWRCFISEIEDNKLVAVEATEEWNKKRRHNRVKFESPEMELQSSATWQCPLDHRSIDHH